MKLKQENAEIIALKVLGWLAADQELCQVFLGTSGASQEDLRSGVSDPAFLASVLDFVMMDDAWVMRCCDMCALAYTDPMMARQSLPGGGEVHWT